MPMENRFQSSHEDFSRDEQIVLGSDRSFGLVMAGALVVVSALATLHYDECVPRRPTVPKPPQ